MEVLLMIESLQDFTYVYMYYTTRFLMALACKVYVREGRISTINSMSRTPHELG